jgi:hypothetical protein
VEREVAIVAVDFSDGGSFLQIGFIAQGATDAIYPVGVFGTSAVMAVDVPAMANPIHTRSFNSVSSSGSLFVPEGAEIGFLSVDHFGHSVAGGNIVVTLSGLDAGTYAFEGWWSDVLQNPGLVFQSLEFSTDGGSSFTTVSSTIDPSGLNTSPVSFPFAADGVQDVVIRVTENSSFNQIRLNAFVVPEPGFAGSLGLGLGLLGILHRRSVRRRNGATQRKV